MNIRNVICILSVFLPACTAKLAAQIHERIGGLDTDAYSVYVEDIITGDILYDYNGEVPLVPASITKAVTTAAVTKLFNPSTRFHTEVLTTGPIVDGVLNGDILLRCFGDPTIASSHFADTSITDSIVAILQRFGVNAVDGSIIVDTRNRMHNGVPQGWAPHDLSELYGAIYAPCNYADNRFSLSYPSLESTPSIGVPEVVHNKRKGKFAISKSEGENKFYISGKHKKGSRSYMFPNSSPHITMALEVENALTKHGIKVGNNTHSLNNGGQLLFVYRSPEFAEILRSLMFRSDNMLAEAMLCTLSPSGSRNEALRMEHEVLKNTSDEWDLVRLNDGSGLSRDNRFPAYFLADILLEMAQSPDGSLYASYFPKAGREGTVRNFLVESQLAGQMALKSGSMSGVQCYAGYRLDNAGFPSHVVVIMVNRFSGSRTELRLELQHILEEIFIGQVESNN